MLACFIVLYEKEIGTADLLQSVLASLPHVAVRSNAMHFQILQQTGVYVGEIFVKHIQMKLPNWRLVPVTLFHSDVCKARQDCEARFEEAVSLPVGTSFSCQSSNLNDVQFHILRQARGEENMFKKQWDWLRTKK